MAQMNLSTETKQSHGHREQTCSCQGGGGERKIGSLGLADVNHCIWKEWAMKFCIEQEAISNHLWWNMTEDSMRKIMYIYI